MAQYQTYDEGYRRGIEAATAGFTHSEITILPVTPGFSSEVLRTFLDNRRKALLTRKVTKWVAVAISPTNGKPYAQGYFQDTKESALNLKTGDPTDQTFIGAFPIEIEVPL